MTTMAVIVKSFHGRRHILESGGAREDTAHFSTHAN